MVKIEKSYPAPKILLEKGKAEREKNCLAYEAGSPISITGKIYGAPEVKQVLIKDQYEKCCFCEADFRANAHGDVEHFRPKGGYTVTRKKSPLQKPGYYWLAYEWDNLMFSCQICNQTHKTNYFPIKEEAMRATTHHDDVNKETPVLIHPAFQDPIEHIYFNESVAVGLSEIGDESIYAYGLNREILVGKRAKFLELMIANYRLSKVNLQTASESLKNDLLALLRCNMAELMEDIARAKKVIENATSPSAPFSAMIRAYFADLP